MQIEKYRDSWLFHRHSRKKISSWVKGLKYFYFKRAWGGHANDGDLFIAHIDYKDNDDLIQKLRQLGIELIKIPDDFPRPILGKEYTSKEFFNFKSEIKGLKSEQPGRTKLFGIDCVINVNDSIEITISGGLDKNYYEVSDIDFENCLKIEKVLESIELTGNVSRKYEKNISYISKAIYPELFK